ncbi:hypothetical protein HME9302_01612 [Alteripontixanthobacter maritimus]|uniref:Uncharacterized protein n=1 Tax=Alteripontixanthobacter maritimus TaxID=2161824 RepID=A0A369QA28_9SPHN|nr:hypothetical protein [Alteripontixanthobacter maritimus]RDC60405.1 hypothetical protein HME9302_01612 [Alteripontixanthobacter maritimus]
MNLTSHEKEMPGPCAPAFFVSGARRISIGLSLAMVAAMLPVSGHAQQTAPQIQAQPVPVPSVQPPPSIRPVPGALELSKLVWSTMAAVDHANISGNYSVLRDMSAQGFQINNNAARLGEVFASIRQSRIDLSNTLLVPPTYIEAPRLVQADVFEVKGLFQIRPTSIQFQIFYQWEQGRWKLYGIDVQPLTMVEAMPAGVPTNR